MRFTSSQGELLLGVARDAIRQTLAGEALLPLDPSITSDPMMMQPAGCFVSLHDSTTHRLRGCMGRLQADEPLVLRVRESAVSVLDDPRFTDDRVTLEELPTTDIEISVLSPLERANNAVDFDLLKHGIYLQIGDRAGCFLPQVARDTGWTKSQLLDRLCTEKMGLPARAWTQGGTLFRFNAVVLGPQ